MYGVTLRIEKKIVILHSKEKEDNIKMFLGEIAY